MQTYPVGLGVQLSSDLQTRVHWGSGIMIERLDVLKGWIGGAGGGGGAGAGAGSCVVLGSAWAGMGENGKSSPVETLETFVGSGVAATGPVGGALMRSALRRTLVDTARRAGCDGLGKVGAALGGCTEGCAE